MLLYTNMHIIYIYNTPFFSILYSIGFTTNKHMRKYPSLSCLDHELINILQYDYGILKASLPWWNHWFGVEFGGKSVIFPVTSSWSYHCLTVSLTTHCFQNTFDLKVFLQLCQSLEALGPASTGFKRWLQRWILGWSCYNKLGEPH